MEEAPENGKESLHSAHAKGMNEWMTEFVLIAFIFNESYTLHSITLPFQRTYNSQKIDTPPLPCFDTKSYFPCHF